MRLGLIFDHFWPGRGGAEASLFGLMEALAARGHDVVVYCRDGQAGKGVTLAKVAVGWGGRGKQERQFAAAAVNAARQDHRLVYGVRHLLDADLYQPHGGTWAATREARHRVRGAGAIRRRWDRLSPKQRYFCQADEQVFAGIPPKVTLAVSEMVREDIARRYGRFDPRVEVVWPAIDRRFHSELREQPKWRAARERKRGLEFLFVGHDLHLKGFPRLLDAFALSSRAQDGSCLRVVGRARTSQVRSLARAAGLEHAVVLEGPQRDMESCYAAADVLVHPTHYDPCALVSLEALASGLPVITTRQNGAWPWVEQGGGRVLGDRFDVEELVAALEQPWRERPPAFLSQRDTVFDARRMTDRIESFLREIDGQRNAS